MYLWLKLTDVTSAVRPVSSSVTRLHPAGSLTGCTGEAGWVKDSPAAVVCLSHWTVLTWKSNKTDRMTSKFIIQSLRRDNRAQTSAGASYGSGPQWRRPDTCRWSSTCRYLAVRGVWNHFFVLRVLKIIPRIEVLNLLNEPHSPQEMKRRWCLYKRELHL